MYKPAGGPGLAVEMLADDIPPTGRFTAACGEPQAVLEGDFIVATGSAAGQKELSRMERDVFLGGGAGRHRSPTGHWASHAEMLNASCRLANREPALCADTRDWPKGGISKLFTVLLCLERGVDTLWLDTDTVVFHDPVPRLRHQVQEAGPVERELLFSAEADAWTCVNNGASCRPPLHSGSVGLGLEDPPHCLTSTSVCVSLWSGNAWTAYIPLLEIANSSIRHVAILSRAGSQRAGTVALPGTLPQTCPAGQCLREEAADDKRAALGFVQTSLHWKLREQRVASDSERMAEVFLPNLTILSDGENPWVLPAVNGHCPLSEALGVEVPYDVSTAAKFKAFEWMGFVRKLPHCGLNQIKMLTELLSQGASVEHENRLAWKMTCIWASIVLAAIVWSIYAVAIIPRKLGS
eukprot:s2206_g2.t1